MPGTNPAEAMRVAAELPDFPHLPELPDQEALGVAVGNEADVVAVRLVRDREASTRPDPLPRAH